MTLGYSFDGALLKQETFSGQINGSIARGYDSDFRTTQLTVNGAAAAFAYDRDSLLTSIGAMTLARASANGFVTGSTLGSVTTTQSYNAFGELASFTANSGEETKVPGSNCFPNCFAAWHVSRHNNTHQMMLVKCIYYFLRCDDENDVEH